MRPHANIVPTLLVAAGLAAVLSPVARGSQDSHGAPAAEGPKGDTIVYVEGGEQKTRADVAIDSADWDNVAYKAGGRAATVPGASVVEIRWGDAPREYETGWRALTARDGRAAKDAFEACMNAKAAGFVERGWVDEYANIGLGEAYLLLAVNDKASFDKAVEAFETARKANPKSLYADRILKGLADAALGNGKPTEAQRFADDLVSAGRSARRPMWEIDGLFMRADALAASGNGAGAGQAYEEASRVAAQQASGAGSAAEKAHYHTLEHRAAAAAGWLLLDKAVASRAAADFDAARSYFNGLPAKLGKEPDVLAAVENANGVIKFSNGDTYGALRHFQSTEVRYFGVPSEVARAIYYQAKCFEKLGDAQMQAARARDLKEFYPKSDWARKL